MPKHVFLWAEDSEPELRSELAATFGGLRFSSGGSSVLEAELEWGDVRLPHLAFARQWLPDVRIGDRDSIRTWASEVILASVGILPDDQPWQLHVEPHYGVRASHQMGARAWHSLTRRGGAPHRTSDVAREAAPDPEAGRHRCELVREAVLGAMQKKRRHLLRQLRPEPSSFTPADSLVQVLLTSPETGFISVSAAPIPFENRHLLSPFPKGVLPVAVDKAAPSRAFAKLIEAEQRLGREIHAGETCVDLGAAPGSWTYTAACRGARVIAIDRSPLRDDLMTDPRVRFQEGDAFTFKPPHPVDWLLCDVVAAPERTAALLRQWLTQGWCRHFVVTLKMKDPQASPGSPGDSGAVNLLADLKRSLPPLTSDLRLTRLCANKKEICVFGWARG